jgi:hypothetical protein
MILEGKVEEHECRKLVSQLNRDVKLLLLETLSIYPVGDESVRKWIVQLSLQVREADPELSRKLLELNLSLNRGDCDKLYKQSIEFREILGKVKRLLAQRG